MTLFEPFAPPLGLVVLLLEVFELSETWMASYVKYEEMHAISSIAD
jgi:hypothetical protein